MGQVWYMIVLILDLCFSFLYLGRPLTNLLLFKIVQIKRPVLLLPVLFEVFKFFEQS